MTDNTKKLETLLSERDRLDIKIENLDERIGKEPNKKNIEEQEKKIKDLENKKAEIENSNAAFYNQLKAWENALGGTGGAGKPSEIYVISNPSLRLNYYMLNTIVKQINASFARFDNPFETYDNYTDAEKRILLESIIPDNYTLPTGVTGLAGSTRVPNDMKNTKTVNATITDWELWEPGTKGATEPTYRSWEWFKRWWAFHRQYPREELAWGTSASDFKGYPELFAKAEGMATLGGKPTPYRNIVPYITKIGKDKLYGSEFDSKLSSSSAIMLLQCYWPQTNVIDDPSIEYDTYYAADFLNFFIDEILRKDKRGGNLLLKPSTTGNEYRVGPKEWREDRSFSFINTGYYTLKNSVSNSYSFTDHDLRGQPINSFTASNYLIVDSNIHRFTSTKGLSGLADLASDIFENGAGSSIGTIAPKLEFYKREWRISLKHSGINNGLDDGLQTDPPEPDFFKDKNIDASPKFKLPDLDKDGLEKTEKEIEKEKDELDRMKDRHERQDDSYKALVAQRRERLKQKDRIDEEIKKLKGLDENALLKKVKNLARPMNLNKPRKFTLNEFTTFREDFEELQDAVIKRLTARNTSWQKGGDGDDKHELKDEYKKGSSQEKKIINLVDSEFDNDDPSLKHKDQLVKAWKFAFSEEKGSEGVVVKVDSYARIINQRIFSKIKREQSINQFLDEWLKDKSSQNISRVNEVLEALKKAEQIDHFDLGTDWSDIKKYLEESDILTPEKTLEPFMKELLKGKTNRKINEIIEMWKKSDYGAGTAFYDLVSWPYDITNSKEGTGKKFHEWLKNDNEGGLGDDAQDDFVKWLISAEEVGDIIGPICEYRIWMYMDSTTTEREKVTGEKLLHWFNEVRKYQRTGFLKDKKDIQGKTAEMYEKEARERIARGPGKVLDLDLSKSAELSKASEWGKLSGDFKDFSKESKIAELASEMDEDFLKGKSKKEYVLSKTPQEVIKEVRSYQIEKSGITAENVANIKKEDKAQVEKVESVLNLVTELIDLKLSTEEHVKLKNAINKQQAVWATSGGEDKKPEDEGEDKKPEDEGEDKKPEGETTTTTKPTDEQKPLYKKPWFWISIIGVVILIGAAIWYFMSGKNKEGDEEEGGEPETTPQA